MLCLVQFLDDWLDFRVAEFQSLLRLNGLQWDDLAKETEYQQAIAGGQLPTIHDTGPLQHFFIAYFPSAEVVRSVCSRSVLVKHVYHLWAHGRSFSEMLAAVRALPASFTDPVVQSSSSWSLQCNAFARSLSQQQKTDIRSNFRPLLPFRGPVDVTNATHEMHVVLDFAACRDAPPANYATTITAVPDAAATTVGATAAASAADATAAAANAAATAAAADAVPCYFGLLLARGGMRVALRKYDLKKRLYLGPTSLDDGLALILANLSGVRSGMLVYDPFVGTASILVGLAHFGALCVGSDIDPRVLRGEMFAGDPRKTGTRCCRCHIRFHCCINSC